MLYGQLLDFCANYRDPYNKELYFVLSKKCVEIPRKVCSKFYRTACNKCTVRLVILYKVHTILSDSFPVVLGSISDVVRPIINAAPFSICVLEFFLGFVQDSHLEICSQSAENALNLFLSCSLSSSISS